MHKKILNTSSSSPGIHLRMPLCTALFFILFGFLLFQHSDTLLRRDTLKVKLLLKINS